ncbi:reverse transcriptase domain-containing protein [Rhodoblastus sp.]|uniref:reverse transcriptase domain-containing protein n=1 Tax=Rhodoblastus sp. TaxID=1962975 RepID=UPI003F9A0E08
MRYFNRKSWGVLMLPETVMARLEAIPTLVASGKRVNGLHRLMGCQLLWEQGLRKIATNKGAMTPGIDGATFADFGPQNLGPLIASVTNGAYKPKPVRRVYIPKGNGKMRPLGIPTRDDRLVQEVARQLLERIYEPVFSNASHGFRPERSCHTALEHVKAVWTGVKWIVDVDVAGFFDNIDHDILLKLLRRRIDDEKFVGLIGGMLKAGVMEDRTYTRTYSGTPQGGIVSPILANIYLHELDEFMAGRIAAFEKGTIRATNPEYGRLAARIAKQRSRLKRIRTRDDADEALIKVVLAKIDALSKQLRAIPSRDAMDAGYRRLRYCRYADDFLIGVIGGKEDARQVFAEVSTFLTEALALSVSDEKSGIRKASDGADFLGYGVRTYTTRQRIVRSQRGSQHFLRRPPSEVMQLHVPWEKVIAFASKKEYGSLAPLKAKHRNRLLSCSDVEIVLAYNAELRGFANYYALARDVKYKLNRLEFLQRWSMFKTLASKHNSSVCAIATRVRSGQEYRVGFEVNGQPRSVKVWKLKDLKCEKFGSAKGDVLPWTQVYTNSRTDWVDRLNAKQCEACGRLDRPCQIHHVRGLADVAHLGFATKMRAARERRTRVLCDLCHADIHRGRLPDYRNMDGIVATESRMQ